MDYLLDANILLRSVDATSEQHEVVLRALASLVARENNLLVSAQGFAEFWAVATRPITVNGLGYSTSLVRQKIEQFRSTYGFLPDHSGSFEIWLELVTKHQVIGKPTHDARLVALMKAHKLEIILTINTSDFKRFTEVKAVHPQEINA